MRRKIDFPITARVIIVTDRTDPIRDLAAETCLEIEQRVNNFGDIRMHVTLDETDIPRLDSDTLGGSE